MTPVTPEPPAADPGAARLAAARFAASAPADLRYALLDSPLGTLVAITSDRGLVCLSYADGPQGADEVLVRVARRLTPRILQRPADLDAAARELDEYFEGRRRSFDLPLDLVLVRGSFSRGVLDAAADIPYGQVASYHDVAASAGSPAAARAAGNALGANPIPIIVPCHRVVRSGGNLGGYTGGLGRKQRLLSLERGELTLGS